ncbi:MAG: CsbD family protein [Tissierellia bacterium]|jgi:uncharacterized protein YjbJ (UPF0337 family)|nr:CsbD family protein [Tissierellia bacterium]
MFNKDVLEGKWKQVEGLIKQKWGKLTDDDLLEVKGNMTLLNGKIQERYGMKKEEVEKQVKEMMDKLD